MMFGDQRKFNRFGKRDSNLTERINLFVTPEMKTDINKLIKAGKFGNKSECIRYCVRRYLDETKSIR